MSHSIHARENGQAVFASTTQEWHGLGHNTAGKAMTVADALKLTGLDRLELVESPLTTTVPTADGVTTMSVDSHKAISLHDTDSGSLSPVAVVGKDRAMFQPPQLLQPMDVLADATGGGIQTVGMLGNGGVWFATVKFPDGWTIAGDKYEGYLLGRDSADGSSAFDIRPTLVRVVCKNTMDMALSQTRRSTRYNTAAHPARQCGRRQDQGRAAHGARLRRGVRGGGQGHDGPAVQRSGVPEVH